SVRAATVLKTTSHCAKRRARSDAPYLATQNENCFAATGGLVAVRTSSSDRRRHQSEHARRREARVLPGTE
ncbi:MAG: hypothetical protein L0Z50_35335, partial [Verrucomicrobiales bacterium]|nr:hypothetical protein [Verrucomicrobiales bacterium]